MGALVAGGLLGAEVERDVVDAGQSGCIVDGQRGEPADREQAACALVSDERPGAPGVVAVLAEGGLDFADPVAALQDLAGLGAVGGAYEAVALHEVDEMGCAAVADAQAALEKAG